MNLTPTHSTRRPLARIVSLVLLGLLLTAGGAIVLRGIGAATARLQAKSSQPALRGQQAIDYLKRQGVYDSVNRAIVAGSPALSLLSCDFAQQAHPVASDGAANDQLGSSVALNGDTLVVGAPLDDVGATDQGSAYVFSRNQGGANAWGQVKKITASDGVAGDNFGWSVSVNGDTIVVGAPTDQVTTAGRAGGAYVFNRNQGGTENWGQVKKLTSGALGDKFGFSVSVDVDTIVVGAQSSGISATGAIYVFGRNQGGTENWGQVKKITGSTSLAEFGNAVAVDGDTIVAGQHNDTGINLVGAAYVFSRNQGGTNNWGQVKKLTASDGANNDQFGESVSVDADTIVVGAWHNNSARGAAYVFGRNQGGANNWGQVKKLTASDGVGGDGFGISVSVDADTIVVGANRDNSLQGSAYVFTRNQGGTDNWGQIKRLSASDGVANDEFGIAVTVAADTIVVGARTDDLAAGADAGSAYVFSGLATCPPTIVAGGPLTRTQGVSASNSTIATVSDAFAGTLTVTATTVPTGISVTNIVNTGGTVTADVAAACTAAIGANTVVLTVTNGTTGLSATANLTVNVIANTPTVGAYANQSLTAGGSLTVTPSAAPSGTTGAIAIASPLFGSNAVAFQGVLTIDPTTGVVRISNAGPSGMYTVTVTVFSVCGTTTTTSFTLTVNAGVACANPGFTGPTNFSAGSGTQALAVGDFNGDGKLDFATANNTAGTVSIRLGDGAGSFSGTTNVSVGSGPLHVAVGDFNGDGKLDFASANNGAGTVSIRLGDGVGNFSGTTNVSVGAGPSSVAVGDFNGDG
ncbi:MAG TPA: FG-GAP-like repeat-containing protein, partial [Blastocatellia bacterium]|nr:FG-GAP-like repeat-containing protein [Blastocatellia bacterium]